jgi:hypothetical protein
MPQISMAQLQLIMRQLNPLQVKQLLGSQPIPPGALVQYYNDLASGVLAPEDMRIEELKFRVQIDPAGNITTQTDAITLVSRYSFVFRRVIGFAMDPDLLGAAPSLVDFQVRENGRNFEIFKRPVSMQALLMPSGPNVVEWDGVYTTIPGTDLDVLWTVDTARWAALVGTTKEIGVQLAGDYIACAPR